MEGGRVQRERSEREARVAMQLQAERQLGISRG